MTLIVEDGTGLSTAESYISVADADARMAALGMTNWNDLTAAEKEQALRRATTYMTQAYRKRWRGARLYRAQALDWPRYGATVDGYDIPSTEVPREIANACADLAFRAASGELAPDTGRAIIREKVGPLETEYDRNSPQGTRYRSVDMILAPFLKGSSAMVGLVRA
jgi:hypothetical protein